MNKKKENDSVKGTVAILNNYRKIKWRRNNLKDHISCELTSGWDSLSEGLDWLLEFAPQGKRTQYESYVSRLIDEQTIIDTVDNCVRKLTSMPGNGVECGEIIRYKYIDGDLPLSDPEIMEKTGIGKNRYYKAKKEAIEILTIFIWSTIDAKYAAL